MTPLAKHKVINQWKQIDIVYLDQLPGYKGEWACMKSTSGSQRENIQHSIFTRGPRKSTDENCYSIWYHWKFPSVFFTHSWGYGFQFVKRMCCLNLVSSHALHIPRKPYPVILVLCIRKVCSSMYTPLAFYFGYSEQAIAYIALL